MQCSKKRWSTNPLLQLETSPTRHLYSPVLSWCWKKLRKTTTNDAFIPGYTCAHQISKQQQCRFYRCISTSIISKFSWQLSGMAPPYAHFLQVLLPLQLPLRHRHFSGRHRHGSSNVVKMWWWQEVIAWRARCCRFLATSQSEKKHTNTTCSKSVLKSWHTKTKRIPGFCVGMLQ